MIAQTVSHSIKLRAWRNFSLFCIKGFLFWGQHLNVLGVSLKLILQRYFCSSQRSSSRT